MQTHHEAEIPDDGGLLDYQDGQAPEVEPELPHIWTWGDYFLSLHPVLRWLVVFVGVGGLAGLVVGMLLMFGSTGSPQPPQFRRPVVVATWFGDAVQLSFNLLANSSSALDAVEMGCTLCEENRCDGTVGWGGSPDSTGETTLDAIIFDGETHDVAAVTDLRRVREAIGTARKVLHYTRHTMLAGEGATAFALSQGYKEQDLHSNESTQQYLGWLQGGCQPNFAQNAAPLACPPYAWLSTPTYGPMASVSPLPHAQSGSAQQQRPPQLQQTRDRRLPRPASTNVHQHNHDTIGMCAIDLAGHIAGGGSSNGAAHKFAGRVSDIAMVGAGLYVDRNGGCAAATGDGDITSRFLPAYAAVEAMRNGEDVQLACEHAVRRIMAYYANFSLGLVCMDRWGNVGAAGHGWTWWYAVASVDNRTATIVSVPPLA